MCDVLRQKDHKVLAVTSVRLGHNLKEKLWRIYTYMLPGMYSNLIFILTCYLQISDL